MEIVCKFCGSSNLNYQGPMIIDEDREIEEFEHLLNHQMCTCLNCRNTFTYVEVD